MKNIGLLWVLFGFILNACVNTKPESEVASQNTETVGKEAFKLTRAQIEMAGITMGKPEKKQISEHLDVTGYIEVPPQNLISVYSPVEAFADRVRFLAGDYVKQGQILLTISHPEIIRQQAEFLESARKKEFLFVEYQRKQALSASDATSTRVLDEAKANYEIEKVHYQGLVTELEYIGIDVKELESSGNIQKQIYIRTPAPGYITKINVNKGKLVQTDDLLYQIVDNRHIHLELQVFAKDLSKIKKNQKIKAYLPGNEFIYPAYVYLVGRMVDLETKTSQIHGHFEKEDVDLVTGTYLQAQILIDEREVWVLPLEAIVRERGETFVFIKSNESYQRIPVELGLSEGDWVEVKNLNLETDQMVVTQGAYYIEGSFMQEE